MNKVIIKHFKAVHSESEDIVYEDGKPVIHETVVDLPLKFGYGSYNEPRKILNTGGINVSHVIEIKPFEE